MRKSYKNPPLKEVLVLFQFEPGWNILSYGMFYDMIKENYTIEKIDPVQRIDFSNENRPEAEFFMKAIFKSQNKPIIIQLGNKELAINHILPYSSWENMLNISLEIVEKIKKITNGSKITNISISYVNNFQIPSNEKISKFFKIVPIEIDSLNPDRWKTVLEFKIKDEIELFFNGKIFNNIYEFEITASKKNEEQKTEISEILEKLHYSIINLFEKNNTDKVRKLWGIKNETN